MFHKELKIPFKPLPDDEPLLDVPQFLRRLREEPGFAEKMRAHYEAALALPLSRMKPRQRAFGQRATKAAARVSMLRTFSPKSCRP